MSGRPLIPLASQAEVPEDMTESRARAFWDEHEITREYLAAAEPIPDEALPPVRWPRTVVGLRVSDDILRRIKALARKKRRSYQELLAEFVIERLYEEEKREGLVGKRSRR